MIDFRYHVVSLVAIFLALAVGIVLGAGPLRDQLSSTLENQVAELREERAGLRAELDEAERRASRRDEVIEVLAPSALIDRLAGVRVGVVLLPDADDNALEEIGAVIAAAGGEVVVRADLLTGTEDPELAATRHEVAAELAPGVEEPLPRRDGEPTVATVIAAVLAGDQQDAAEDGVESAEERLVDLDLVSITWLDDETDQGPVLPDRSPPDLLLVVSGGLTGEDTGEPEGAERLELRLDLVHAVAALNLPTVVLGFGGDEFTPEDEDRDPLISGIRDDALGDAVSTVDHADTETGGITLVLAAGWTMMGEPGHYGMATDAEDVVPAVPPVRVVTDEPDDDISDPLQPPLTDPEPTGEPEDSTGPAPPEGGSTDPDPGTDPGDDEQEPLGSESDTDDQPDAVPAGAGASTP